MRLRNTLFTILSVLMIAFSSSSYAAQLCWVLPGSINGSQSDICTGGDPTILGSATNGMGSGNGTLSYQWQRNFTGCGGSWTNITGATSNTYDPPAGITQTTWYRRVAINTVPAPAASCSANSNCVVVTVVAGTSLLGSVVDGNVNFGGSPTNYFDSDNGFVPGGCGNSGTGNTTVVISNPNSEFCIQDNANSDAANFTGNTLTLSDISQSGGTYYTMTFQMAPGSVTSINKTSDNFLNGGVSYSLVGNTITLNVPAFGSGGTFIATFELGVGCVSQNNTRMANPGATNTTSTSNASMGNSSATVSAMARKTPPTMRSTEVKIYPNPSSGISTLELPQFDNQAQISVSDMRGQIVMRKTVGESDSHSVKLDLGNAARGVYFVEVNYGDVRNITKMVVQ